MKRKIKVTTALLLVLCLACAGILGALAGCVPYADPPAKEDDAGVNPPDDISGETENPSDPTNPGETENPSDPTNPGETEDPSDPETPGDPENPSDPEDPSDPENPENPSDPEDPSDPENPENPSDPETPDNPDDPEQPKPQTEKTVYFYNESNWAACYAYAWSEAANAEYLGVWAGKAMTRAEDNWYSVSLSSAAQQIIFNNGVENSKQTKDLTLDFDKPYYYCGEWLSAKPEKAKELTVYYTNNLGWEQVYAYLWQDNTEKNKASWPGELCTSVGVSAFGEPQFSFTADPAKYNRIIFNDGKGNQTKNLCFNRAQSGFYDLDNTFVYGINEDEYGSVDYVTLTDNTNIDWKGNDHTKKISIYKPFGYTTDKTYGVLYMFDGQNMYAGATGAHPTGDGFGSWATDVAVRALMANGAEGIIIVGIDNADGYRDMELTMSTEFGELVPEITKENGTVNPKFYDGQLEKLGNFITDTLMPYVRDNYSVSNLSAETGIAGSSSGGLAAYYVGMRKLGTFGYIGAFSPANALFTDKAWEDFYKTLSFTAENSPNIYVYCGSGDNYLEDELIEASRKIKEQLSQTTYSGKITEYYTTSSNHTEVWWRLSFTEFLSLNIG